VVEWAGLADRGQGTVGFDARRGASARRQHVDADFDVERSLQRPLRRFAIALGGMAIAEVEQRAGLEYRQVDGRSFDDAVEVHVAAEAAGIARRSGCEAEVRGNGQPAQHRTQGNGVVLESSGWVLEAGDAVLAVQMPSHPVA